ncbi:hypothetical protein AF332_11335 [Sporosarcina globispora]|uniref:Uncharacterized protein n=1 Tax=Sporosarcina globispora TaxID=1459 RepID=A0A0M0GBY9_SPOGL|nr:hypothetical protein AF332_11335 [Sporosarcina globispora]
MSRKVKSVSFNLNDPWELEIYEYTLKYPNFSSFVKRLIQSSVGGVAPQKTSANTPSNHNSIIQPEVNKDYMRQLI